MKSASSEPPVPRRTPNLEPDKVLTAALELLNEVGFEGLTLRRLAARLEVKAAALYWHFKNKQDLIDHLASKIMAEEFTHTRLPDNPTWQDLLELVGYTMRGALRRYRDGALVIASADLTKGPNMQGREYALDMLMKQGFSGELALLSMFDVVRFTLGCVFEEQADPRTKLLTAQMQEDFATFAKQYPATAQALSGHDMQKATDPDEQYRRGLRVILAGVESMLQAQKTSKA